MFHFVSHSDETVDFTKEEAWEIPYARDAFDEFFKVEEDSTLLFPYASTLQLTLLRDAIKAKLKCGSYSPKKETFLFGDRELPLPPFTGLLWSKPFEQFLYSLNHEEIAELINSAHSTCMWALRNNVIRMMFIRIIMNDSTLAEFFPVPNPHLQEVMCKVYYSELTTVSRSGYCDLPHSNDSD
jgi:hypothetical protein